MSSRYRIAWARRLPARLLRAALQLLAWIGIAIVVGRPRVTGREHLAGLPGPLVLAANHSSHLDTTVILNALPFPVRQRTLVVAAADYFYTDRLRAALVSLTFGTIPVERGDASSDDSTERMHRLLDEGWNLLLYPEGTRSRDGRMGALHSGAAHFARTHGAPLVPIGVLGTHAALPPGRSWPRRSDISVRIGAPIGDGGAAEGEQPSPPVPDGDAHDVTQRLAASLRELTGQDGP